MKRRSFIMGGTAFSGLLASDDIIAASLSVPNRNVGIPYVKGRLQRVFPPPGQRESRNKTNPDELWYVNDHCFFVTDTGEIHWFGITNPYPSSGENFYGPGSHRHIGHTSAKEPFGPWTEHEFAFTLPKDTQENIGACFVVRTGDKYVMIYGYNSGFSRAISKDLYNWDYLDDIDPIFLGEGTRDPCVVILDSGDYLLFAAAGNEGYGAVVCASSPDLETWQWQQEEPALLSDVIGSWGPLESPFVYRHDNLWYLFVNHSHHQYEETLVFVSENPGRFDWNKPLCTIFGHAIEIFDWGGKTYISHCGIEDRHWGSETGLYLAELAWR